MKKKTCITVSGIGHDMGAYCLRRRFFCPGISSSPGISR